MQRRSLLNRYLKMQHLRKISLNNPGSLQRKDCFAENTFQVYSGEVLSLAEGYA